MGFSFEARLREAEQTINTLINTANREGGGVYICDREDTSGGYDLKLRRPISIIYWMPVKQRGNENE